MKISKISAAVNAAWNEKFPLHDGWQTVVEREVLGDSVLVECRLLKDGKLMSNAADVWNRPVPYAEVEDTVRMRLFSNCGIEFESVSQEQVVNVGVVPAPQQATEATLSPQVVMAEVKPSCVKAQAEGGDLFAGSLPYAKVEDVATAPTVVLPAAVEPEVPVAPVVEVAQSAPSDNGDDLEAESRRKRDRASDDQPANPALIRAGNLSRGNRGLPPLPAGATKGQAMAAIRGEDN